MDFQFFISWQVRSSWFLFFMKLQDNAQLLILEFHFISFVASTVGTLLRNYDINLLDPCKDLHNHG